MSSGDEDDFSRKPIIIRQTTGWPSPAEDHTEESLDLLDFLRTHPAATFFMETATDAMIGEGIRPHDVLVIDCSLTATDGDIVIAIMEGEFVLRRFRRMRASIGLVAENPAYPPIVVRGEMEAVIWGEVAHVIHTYTKPV